MCFVGLIIAVVLIDASPTLIDAEHAVVDLAAERGSLGYKGE